MTAERLSISWTSTTRPDSATCAFHYSREPEEPTHYHLVVDSTARDLDDVVDVIVRASEARGRRAGTG